MRIVDSGAAVGALLFAVGRRAHGTAARDGAVEAGLARRRPVAASRSATADSGPVTRVVLETRVGIGQSPGAGRVATVEGGITAQTSADHQVVGGGDCQQDLAKDDQHLQVKSPASAQGVG